VRYIFSRYARTNNGVYALMDIKGHNRDRLFELHNIISDGVHKVEEIEESVQSLFLGVMNPEDEKNISGFQSLTDRIELININYVLESTTEVAIYENIFGRHIHESFLPRVLENFARVIISSRLNESLAGAAGMDRRRPQVHALLRREPAPAEDGHVHRRDPRLARRGGPQAPDRQAPPADHRRGRERGRTTASAAATRSRSSRTSTPPTCATAS
jgi:hypothetical protein